MSRIDAIRSFAEQRPSWRIPVDLAHRGLWFLARKLLGPRRFIAGGVTYSYLVHPFILNNERAVEIPVALKAAQDTATRLATQGRRGPRILEVGNVLSTYADLASQAETYVVVDKYERVSGVRNVDILDYDPPQKFDLILSVSTLEHVGRDEEPRDDAKALRALAHLRELLAPGGRLVFTFPIGYNLRLDRGLDRGLDQGLGLGAPTRHEFVYLERIDGWNRWREADVESVLGHDYGSPFPNANGLVLGFFDQPKELA